MPKLVGTVVAIAGFGYLFDAAARVVVDDPSFSLSVITGLGEFVLGVWLVSKAHRISVPNRCRQTTRERRRRCLASDRCAISAGNGETMLWVLCGSLGWEVSSTWRPGHTRAVLGARLDRDRCLLRDHRFCALVSKLESG